MIKPISAEPTQAGTAPAATPPRRAAAFALSVVVEHDEGRQRVRIAGEVDLYTAAQLQHVIFEALATGPTTIDLSGLNFIDSRGLSALVAAHRRALERNVSLQIRGARGGAARVLRVTGLHAVLPLTGGTESAT